MSEVVNVIKTIESTSAPQRFTIEEKKLLLDWAADTPKAVEIPASTYSKLKVATVKKDATHYPIIGTFLERFAGSIAKSLGGFTIKSTSQEFMDFKKLRKQSALLALTQKVLESQSEDEFNAYIGEVELELNKEDNLDEEVFASKLVGGIKTKLENSTELDRGRYNLRALGEYFTTVDILPDSLNPRICDPMHVTYLAGEDKFNIGTSDGILEDLQWSVSTVLDRFNVTKTVADKLIKIQDSPLNKEGTRSNSSDIPAIIEEGYKFKLMYDDDGGNTSNEFVQYDNLIHIQKVTWKAKRKRKKVFESVVNIQEDNFTIESYHYSEKDHEKVEIIYESVWKLAYYVPDINTVLYEKEIHIPSRKQNKADNRNSMYSGYVQTLDFNTPYSWINSILPYVKQRNAIYSNIDRHIADNLGLILAIEPKIIPDKINYKQWLSSLVNNKIVHFDSTQQIGKSSLGGVVGSVVKDPIRSVNLDNSSLLMANFQALREIENSIVRAAGTNHEAAGEVQQNARVGNVQHQVQQAAHVRFNTVKILHLGTVQLYKNTIDVLQFINSTQKLSIKAMLNNLQSVKELHIPKGSFTAAELTVEFSITLEDLMALEAAKEKLAELAHQKVVTAREYFSAINSHSIAEILALMEESEQRANESAQQQQQAQQEAAVIVKQTDQEHELNLIREQGKVNIELEKQKIQGQLALKQMELAQQTKT